MAYDQAEVVLVCFSYDDDKTYDHAKDFWIKEMEDYCKDRPIILVGCKSDLEVLDKHHDEVVQETKDLEEKEKRIEDFIECSALNLENIEEVF